MNLPYNPPYQSIWTTPVEDNLSHEAWDKLFEEDARRRSEAILDTLVADASTIPGYLAVCMTTASAHDYEFQTIVVQLQDGTFLTQSWDSLSQSVSEMCPIELRLNLMHEFIQLRSDGTKLRSQHNQNADLRTGMEGRYGIIYLAVGNDAEWVTFPRPLLNGRYHNNAINRLYSILHNMSDKVELI